MTFLAVLAIVVVTVYATPIEYERELMVPVFVKNLEGRITNGQTARSGQFPYQVGLSLKLNWFSSSWCGGSLIGKTWVLTAAHCTDGVKVVTVYLGATVRTSSEAKFIISGSDIIIHEGWNSKTVKNDISLIKIPPVIYTNKIQPVKLPKISKSYANYNGEMAIASGWGLISDTASSLTNNLQYAYLKIVPNSVCANIYGYSIVTSGNVCVATTDAISTCNGDSGGPLVLDSSKVLVGLTSFGASAGCTLGYPAAFTRVTSYLDWIESKTGISA